MTPSRTIDRLLISELSVGDSIDAVFLQVNFKRLTVKKTNREGVRWTVRDSSGEIGVLIWETDDNMLAYGHTWTTMRVRGRVEQDSYNGGLQIRATAVFYEAVSESDRVALEPTSTFPQEHYWEALRHYINALPPPLDALVEAVLAQSQVARLFSEFPAARSMHHAVRGGLLQHTTEVVWLADAIAIAIAKSGVRINRDLVIASAILHDAGKVDEYAGEGGTVEYGRASLLGHIVHGQFRIRDAAATIKDFPADLLLEVLHIVVAHHGRKEFGSPIAPAFIEADIVHYADLMSARTSARQEVLANGPKLFETHPMLEGHQYRGERWGDGREPIPSITPSRGVACSNAPTKPSPAEPPEQPSLFATEARARANVAPVVVAGASDDDLDDPFA